MIHFIIIINAVHMHTRVTVISVLAVCLLLLLLCRIMLTSLYLPIKCQHALLSELPPPHYENVDVPHAGSFDANPPAIVEALLILWLVTFDSESIWIACVMTRTLVCIIYRRSRNFRHQ